MFRLASRFQVRVCLPFAVVLAMVSAPLTPAASDPALTGQPGSAELLRTPQWTPGFNKPGVDYARFGMVTCAVEFGGDLVFAGFFRTVGSELASYIARWDGERVHGLGAGVESPVLAIAVVGQDLVAALQDGRIVRWDGARWTTIGTASGRVTAMIEFRGDLVAAGRFAAIDGVGAGNIARWNGSGWSSLGGAVGGVGGLAVWRDDLYVGGSCRAGSLRMSYLARWDGASWYPVLPGPSGTVRALEVHDDRLVVAGLFRELGDELTGGVAAWDGSTWTALWRSLPQVEDVGFAWTLRSTRQGLVLASWFPGGFGLQVWNGHAWRALTLLGDIDTLLPCVVAEYRGDLVLGGDFELFRGRPVSGLVVQHGTDWRALIPGAGLTQVDAHTLSSRNAFAMLEWGGGLVVGGEFNFAGETPARSIALWNGSEWKPLGTGIGGSVYALATYNGDLVAGGIFPEAGGTTAWRVARWDGTAWHPFGAGFGRYTAIHAFAVFEGDLIAGGDFSYSGSRLVHNIARWDGTSWQPMAVGLFYGVRALAVYRDQLIAGGTFDRDGFKSVPHVARWTGSTWEPLGGGSNGQVDELLVDGDRLYAAGSFSEIGGVPAPGLAVWDGSSWTAVERAPTGRVSAVAMHAGRLVIASGYEAPGTAEWAVQLWNGSSWELLGTCSYGWVNALCSTDRGLFVGGEFFDFGGRPASSIACWVDGLTSAASQPAGPAPGEPSATAGLEAGFVQLSGGGVSIAYSVGSPAETARLGIYDVRGRLIRELEPRASVPGRNLATWDGRDARGARVARGVYFVELSAGSIRKSGKVVLLAK